MGGGGGEENEAVAAREAMLKNGLVDERLCGMEIAGKCGCVPAIHLSHSRLCLSAMMSGISLIKCPL